MEKKIAIEVPIMEFIYTSSHVCHWLEKLGKDTCLFPIIVSLDMKRLYTPS